VHASCSTGQHQKAWQSMHDEVEETTALHTWACSHFTAFHHLDLFHFQSVPFHEINV